MNWNKETTARLIEVIGQSVKSRRVAKEISQEALAKLSGVSHASIARFETGKGNISLENLLLILKALEMADELKIIFKEKELSPTLLAKATTKKTKERVRKSQKKNELKSTAWKWGDEK
jgi:transcriptional regulator with XRE-family HTH domain